MVTQLLEREKKERERGREGGRERERENEKKKLIVEKELRKTYYESIVGLVGFSCFEQ